MPDKEELEERINAMIDDVGIEAVRTAIRKKEAELLRDTLNKLDEERRLTK